MKGEQMNMAKHRKSPQEADGAPCGQFCRTFLKHDARNNIRHARIRARVLFSRL